MTVYQIEEIEMMDGKVLQGGTVVVEANYVAYNDLAGGKIDLILSWHAIKLIKIKQ